VRSTGRERHQDDTAGEGMPWMAPDVTHKQREHGGDRRQQAGRLERMADPAAPAGAPRRVWAAPARPMGGGPPVCPTRLVRSLVVVRRWLS
jgi:hypothetical protein